MLTDAAVPRFWHGLDLPGLVDVHVHFYPDRMLRKVWQHFDAGSWPITYRWPDGARVAHLAALGVRAYPALSYAHRAVAKLVKRVQRGIDRPAQNASVSFSTGVLRKVKARNGHFVKRAELTREVQLALAARRSSRKVTVPLTVVKPKITTRQLASNYPTVITINRGAFALTLYKKLKQVRSYTIAVGRQGLETPAGEYTVQDKQINPSWHVPHSSWAGKLAGQVIPPGPQDPLKARWIGITGGAGIHGTSDIGSLGSAASHGCIRMSIPDVIELYGRTPYGSKIFVY